MDIVRAVRAGAPGVGARPPSGRIRSLTSSGRSSLVSLGRDRPGVALPAAPDPRLAGASTVGLRRLHHVLIELRPTGTTCTVAGTTRNPVRRRVPLGAALALADQGVPTFVTDRTGS